MQTKVKCEKCNGEFEMSQTNLQKRNLPDGIEEIYFNCPLCDEFFPVMKTNLEIRTLVSKQNYMRDKFVKKGMYNITDEEKAILIAEKELEIATLKEELNVTEQ